MLPKEERKRFRLLAAIQSSLAQSLKQGGWRGPQSRLEPLSWPRSVTSPAFIVKRRKVPEPTRHIVPLRHVGRGMHLGPSGRETLLPLVHLRAWICPKRHTHLPEKGQPPSTLCRTNRVDATALGSIAHLLSRRSECLRYRVGVRQALTARRLLSASAAMP